MILTKEDFQIIDDDSEFYANAKLINIYSEKLGWRDKRDIIIQILQNQEDAEKRRELVCPRCDGYIDTVVNSVHLVICENGHEFDDSNKIIVEQLKKRIEECEDKSDFESVGEVEFTYRLENELKKILGERSK